MARSESPVRSVVQTLAEQSRVHLRVIVPVGAAVAVGVVLVGLVIGLYAAVLGRVAYAQLVEFASSPESATTLSVLLVIPIVVVALSACLVWAGTAVQISNAAATSRRISTGGAALVALRRGPRALLVALFVALAFLAAVVVTPLLVLLGVVGLVLGRLAPRLMQRWPSRPALIAMAVPFGAAVALVLRWSLALASVWLSGTTLRPALADSSTRVRGREPIVAFALLLSAGVSLAATEGLVAAFGTLGLGSYPEFVVRVLALVVVGPLPWVALALQYRAGGDAPPAAAATQVGVARRARIAIAVIVAMIVPLLAWGSPGPAIAAGSSAVSFTISTVEAEPLPVGTATTVTFSVTDAVTAEGTQPTGAISISIDGTPLTGPFVLAGNGSAYQLSHTFTAGSHLIEAAYPGDATYEAKTASLTVQAGPPPDPVATTTSFTVSPASPSAAGGALSAHVTVTANEGTNTPTGTVGIYIDDQSEPALDEATLVAGEADLDFSLPPGMHRLVVYYEADAGFQNSHIDETQVVARYTSSVVLSAAGSSAYGDTVEVTATVTAGTTATGDVTLEAIPDGGGAPLSLGTWALDSSGVATMEVSGLPVGDYDLVAHYLGDSSVLPDDSAAFDHTVTEASVDVDVVSSLVAPSYADTTLLTVTVTPAEGGVETPTGTVSVARDGNPVGTGALVGGVANVTVNVGDAGDRHFVVTYLPAVSETRFTTGSGSLDLAVAKLGTTTTLFDLADSSGVYGDALTFEGTVSAASGPGPTGTVQLWVGGYHVADGSLDTGGFEITTTLVQVGATLNQDVWIVYPGDANHDGSESFPRKSLELVRASSAPVLSASAGPYTVGDTVALTATLDNLGDGPTGTVTFTDISTHPDTVLGAPTIVGHTATLDVVVSATTMQIVASYSGDDNFEGVASTTFIITAGKVTPTVTLDPVGDVDYGSLLWLDATVSLGSLPAASGVQFQTSAKVLATSVPVVAGHARLQVCAAAEVDCPVGMPFLDGGTGGFTAVYPETTVNFSTVSASAPYSVVPAATTTTVANSAALLAGSAVPLTATVAGTTSPLTPTGTVTFYAVRPGGALVYLDGPLPLVDGEASTTVLSGDGIEDVPWDAEAIRADYFSDSGLHFASSQGSSPIAIDRYGVTIVSTSAVTVDRLASFPVSVRLDHEPGTSAAYTGVLTITPDVGPGCTNVAVPVFPDVTTGCTLSWSTTGAHSFTVSYSGDDFYDPAGPTTFLVGVGAAIPNFHPSMDFNVIAGTDVTVSWNQFDAAATGTVTVQADGAIWCTVPVNTLSCTSQFGNSSVTGSPVVVDVTYSGDSTWSLLTRTLTALVKRCVTIDVTSAQPSLGSVSIDTPSNCGSGGYLNGTPVTVTATPTSPNVFVNWKKLGGSSLVVDTTLSTTTFLVTADFMTWVRVATFSAPCYPVVANVTGHGKVSVYPATNCTLTGGGGGYAPGTSLAIYPDPLYNPDYDEPDAFYSFGATPGAVIGVDSSNRPLVRATVNGPLTIPVTFGPQCRPVRLVFEPASTGDAGTVLTEENCHSPQADGFVRDTEVTVNAVSGDPTLAIAGWSLNGVAQPDWGTANEQTLVIGAVAPVLTVQLTHCYRVDITIDGAVDPRGRAVGQVNPNPEPNCPDGSDRYLRGTEVVLTPEILIADAAFTGWGVDRLNYRLPEGETGEVPRAARTETLTADLAITAGFFYEATCSRLGVFARPGLIQFDDTGCGAGYYFDLQKQSAIRNGEEQSFYWQSKYRSTLTANINPDIPLDVYVSVRGDTRYCFGNNETAAGPSVNTSDWKTYGPIDRPTATCQVGGPIDIRAQACQSIVTDLELHVAGRPESVYGSNSIPGTLYLPGPDGLIGAFSMDGFDWAQGTSVYVNGSTITATDIATGPCRDAGNAFPADTDLAIFALAPGDGFTFGGWSGLDPNALVAVNPVLATTTSTEPELHVAPSYTVTCHTVTFGEGVSIIGDAPYCPGSSPEDNSFIAGTAIQVKAANSVDSRSLYGFTSGIVAAQVYEDPTTKELTGFALVDKDKHVAADYPTKGEAFERGVVQGLKIGVGVFAVAAPIFVGLLFPPAGILFAYLGAAAGIASLVPNGGSDVAAVFDLINPTKITQCAAQWAFSNPGDPTGSVNGGAILSTANTIRKIANDVDVSVQPVGALGGAAAVAGFGYGLYSAGIGNTDLSPQTVEELRGTSTMTGCLDDQWRVAGSNITGG